MKKWIVQWHSGICGTDEAVAVLAYTEDNAIDICISDAHEQVEGMQDLYGGNDEDWEYDPSDLDIWAEEYDPEKHDGLSCNGTWNFE